MKKGKFYITTSIPYTNASPHIGFALEIIQADIAARYQRSLGKDTLFLTGTDEHGLKTKRAAEALGKTAEAFANETSQQFKNLREALNVSTDDFIRTTDAVRHKPSVEKLWKALQENGDLYKKKYKGFYCPGCEAFKTAKEVVDGKCVIHQKEVEVIEEENYFFKISTYLPKVRSLIEKDELRIIPESKKNEVISMIDGGLDDVSFSRDKDKYWGFFVPGDDSQVIYVWADALPNYISAIGYADDQKKFNTYWPADVHCIGKDIVKFHALYWPSMLLSLGLDLPKMLFVHGFITVDGQKMSKSLGNVVDPFALVQKYGTDPVRYYLLREITPTEDGDFSHEKFEQRYNGDLAGGIGNLLARTLALAKKPVFKAKKPSAKVVKEAKEATKNARILLEDFKFNESLKALWDLIGFADKYINEEKPWEGKENASQTISDALHILSILSDSLQPFLPETAERVKRALESRESVILFPKLV